ncbi:MAG: hypothetical protein K2G24_07120 [Muribaculaceae bacterium]|nr:hypothetical protein [Muribaculaceae bacterium]
MKSLKFFLAVTFAVAVCLQASAWRSMVLRLYDGAVCKIAFSDELSMRFTDGEMFVSDGTSEFVVPLGNLAGFEPSDEVIDADDDDDDDDGGFASAGDVDSAVFVFRFDGDRLLISGPAEVGEGYLFTSGGMLVGRIATAGTVNLAGLDRGLYILKIGRSEFKFVLR